MKIREGMLCSFSFSQNCVWRSSWYGWPYVCVLLFRLQWKERMYAWKHLLKHFTVQRNGRTRGLSFRGRGVVMWSSAKRRDGQYGFWWEERAGSRNSGLGHGGGCKSDL